MLLDVDSLVFRYEHRQAASAGSEAVAGVSFTVPAEAIVGILGPNGAGKTTLIRLLCGALRPARGHITFDGRDLQAMARHQLARRIAVVPQETHLAFEYTVLEMVLMGRYPRLGAFQIEGPRDLDAAMRALHATGTDQFAERPFTTLSGGEKQRVVIAAALAQLDDADDENEPRGSGPAAVLLLDEPTASLDLRYQLELAMLLRRLNDERGLTLVLSTHDLRLAVSLCTHVVLLSAGRVLAQGPPGEVVTEPLIAELYGVRPDLVRPLLA